MLKQLCLLGLLGLACAETYFKETFDDAMWEQRWVQSEWKDNMGKWELSSGKWNSAPEIAQGIQTSEDAKFYGIGAKLETPFTNKDKDLVVQFSVKNEDREYSFCGGGYIKLLPADTDLAKFGGESPYFIMFGPDMCGYDVSRIHLIFNYKGENLVKKDDIKLEYDDKNEFTHLYTLVVKPDMTYTVYFDLEEKATGSISEEWDFPSKMIDDPDDKKPDDWVDAAMIPDPDDVKPEDWDDIPEEIPDPDASKPDDWDDEDDGEWEPPMIPNPEFKGEWVQKMIENPDYKGPWKAKQLDNPEYDPSVYAFENIGAVGFELWIVNKGSIFDNIYVGDSLDEAKAMAEETFKKIIDGEKEAKEAYDEANKPAEPEEDEEPEAEPEEDEGEDLDAAGEEKEEL